MQVFHCRLCYGDLSSPKLDLGSTPLANEFLPEKINQDFFPLQVCQCLKCGHYQLNQSIDPERLFRNYCYVAGTSPVNVKHFEDYAQNLYLKTSSKEQLKVLDIASNDGTLLKAFKNLGCYVLGIDPAKNLAEIATTQGIHTLPEFFTNELAEKVLNEYGQFDLITANNVFAHIPDMIGFTQGVKKLLKPNGIFSFEVSYFPDVCDNLLFDTIYHEHTSYHHLTPLLSFFQSHELAVYDVEHISNHGGSVRVFVTHSKPQSFNLIRMLENENNLKQRVAKLAGKIEHLGDDLRRLLASLKDEGKSIAIYGVPAKATTLMYSLDINESLIDFAVDDNPLKQKTFTPGKHIPVYSVEKIYQKKPDVILILAWNFASSIIKKLRSQCEYSPIFITPIPELSVSF